MNILSILDIRSINWHSLKQLPPESFWIIIISIGIFSLYFFYKSYQYIIKARTIEDIPTAKIRSAAQGYTRLQGTIQPIRQVTTLAPLSQTPCAWYNYCIEFYSKDGWRLLEQGKSQQLFALADGTGVCVIDPNNAQVETPIHDLWYGFSRHPNGKPRNILSKMLSSFGRFRYQEWRLQSGEPLTAMGHFRTHYMQENDEYLQMFKVQYGISPTSINLLSSEATSSRNPLILTAMNQNKQIRSYKIAALIWFIAYISILAIVTSMIISRFNV